VFEFFRILICSSSDEKSGESGFLKPELVGSVAKEAQY
jgi:hypothetical protein